MSYESIKRRIKFLPDGNNSLFELIREVFYFYSLPDTKIEDGVDLIIRLLSSRKEIEDRLDGSASLLDSIAREAGLFPYMKSDFTWRDVYASDAMAVPGSNGMRFHIEQAKVFSELARGRSVILSAPTSFGKSLLIDALIAFKQPNTVVACVPTIALLDEFRRRMKRKFGKYQILTSPIQVRDSQKKAIFIGTQERLRERRDLENVDLFILDEFYKLDLTRGDDRALTLNAILSSIGREAKQIYLLGPSIDDVDGSRRFRPDTEFIKTKYSPVAADIIDRTRPR